MTTNLVRLKDTPDLVDRVYRALLDAISEGRLQPGSRITQDEIATQLVVSRQPVLQALLLLKKDGLILDAPGRGVLVAPLDAKVLTNVYQVRSSLDGLAARLACGNGYQFNKKQFADLLAAGRQAVQKHDMKAMIDADIAFHTAIYQAANNPLIEQSAQLHWHHIRRTMGAVLQKNSIRQTAWDEHAAIALAIESKDADLAEQLMRSHGLRASSHLCQHLAQSRETNT
jgi:DNA-binding GntR family transcriptional regulator